MVFNSITKIQSPTHNSPNLSQKNEMTTYRQTKLVSKLHVLNKCKLEIFEIVFIVELI